MKELSIGNHMSNFLKHLSGTAIYLDQNSDVISIYKLTYLVESSVAKLF